MATSDSPVPSANQIVLVYSDNSLVRAAIKRAISPAPAPDMAPIVIREFATAAALREYFDDKGQAHLLIVDGEAAPEGGLGVARALKDEIYQAPPILGVIAREADRWLATWARVDGLAMHPIEPRSLALEVRALLVRKESSLVESSEAHPV